MWKALTSATDDGNWLRWTVYFLEKVGGIAVLQEILFSVEFLSTIKEVVKQPANREGSIIDLPFE